jgi:hypothetical protein
MAFRALDRLVVPGEIEFCFRVVEVPDLLPCRDCVARSAICPEFSAVPVLVARRAFAAQSEIRLPGIPGKRCADIGIANVFCVMADCALDMCMPPRQGKPGQVMVDLFRFEKGNAGREAEVFLMAGDAFFARNGEMIPAAHFELALDGHMTGEAFSTADGLANVMALGTVIRSLEFLVGSRKLTR